MPGIGEQQPTFEFGVFELNPRTGELRKQGTKLKVQDQPFQILMLLLEHSGEIVTREEIQNRLWPDSTYVDFDNAINNAVRKLRSALGDDAESPRFLETLARRGYRFIYPVSIKNLPLQRNSPVAVGNTLPAAPKEKAQDTAEGHYLWWSGAVAVPVLALLIFLFLRPISTPSYHSAVPLTSEAGVQLCPSFAPDGERVAFSWNGGKSDNFDIYVKQIGVGAPLRLTKDSKPDLSPAWSPDGHTIAFLRLVSGSTAQVLLIPALAGGPERHIAEVSVPISLYAPISIYWNLRLLAWSPDGKWLAVPDGPSADGVVSLFLLSIETGAKRRLTFPPAGYDDWDPAFSPDGKHLAFVRHSDAAGDVYVLDLTRELRVQGEPKRLTFDHRPMSSPAWTLDGRALLSTRYGTPGRHSLWRITLSSPPRLEPLSISTDSAVALALSPRGDRLIYARQINNVNIWAVDLPSSGSAKGASAPRLWSASSERDMTPSFSPDGRQVAFQSLRSGYGEIWIADRDGSSPRQLTELGGSVAGFPKWSPDGGHLVFHSRQESYPRLLLLNLATGRSRTLGYPAVFETMPSWTHDGKGIYFASRRSGENQVWKATVDGTGPITQVTRHGGWAPLESADGRSVFYTKPTGPGLWKKLLSASEEQQLLFDEVSAIGTAYAPVRNGIYFIRQTGRPDRQNLAFFRFADGRITTIIEIIRPVDLGLAVSPDERTLLYSQVDNVSSELMLVDKFN